MIPRKPRTSHKLSHFSHPIIVPTLSSEGTLPLKPQLCPRTSIHILYVFPYKSPNSWIFWDVLLEILMVRYGDQ